MDPKWIIIRLEKDPPNHVRQLSFENFIFANEPFAKALQSLETCASVNNNLGRKLVSSVESPATFNERFKVTSLPFLFLILAY